MKYFVAFGVLIACVVIGLLGFTLGVNLNPDSTTRYVLNWGSLGDWVAGLGSIIAVGTTIYLAQREREDQKERLSVELITQPEIPYLGKRLITVQMICSGTRPVKVCEVQVFSRDIGYGTVFLNFASGELPVTLSYGESYFVSFHQGTERTIRDFIQQHCNGCSDGLELRVFSTLQMFKIDFPVLILSLNDKRPLLG